MTQSDCGIVLPHAGNRLNADIELDEGRLDDVEELLAARGRGRQQPHRATRRSYLSNNVGGGDDY